MRNALTSCGNKIFGYYKPLYKDIIQKELKFKLSNLVKKYDGFLDLFDHIASYEVLMYLQEAKDKIRGAFTMTLERGVCI